MNEPIWWAIYLGPQQQKQPDRGGPGCMLYPFDPRGTCATQPRINITNIKLKDIVVKNSLLFPIVMRCNETNPCKNITYENVQARGWLIGKRKKGYVCEHIVGQRTNSYPELDCLKSLDEVEPSRYLSAEEDTSVEELDYGMVIERMERASKSVPYE